MRAAEEANRPDTAELTQVYNDLVALLSGKPTPQANGTSNGATHPAEEPASAPKPPPEPPKAKVEVAEIGKDGFGKQDAVLGFLHKFKGQAIDVDLIALSLYPGDDPSVAYKKVYATLDAMVRNEKAEKVKGERSRWNPLVPRDPRPIRLPNGETLEAAVSHN